MKAHSISCLLLVATLAVAAKAAGVASEPGDKPAGASAAMPQSNSGPVLDKGMSADEIVALLGKPASVVPMNTGGVKAEKWIYRHLVDHKVVQEATNVTNESAFVGNGGQNNNNQGSRVAVQYSLKNISTYQFTALLMVEGHLVVAKQWTEQQASYDH